MNKKRRESKAENSAVRDSDNERTSLSPLSTEDALSALFQIPDPEKAVKDADDKSRKGRKK